MGFEFKTEAATAYEKAIIKHLAPFVDQIKVFASQFDKKKHGLEAKWVFETPDFYTKEGKISENSVDLDAHKVLQDTIMECVGVDDAYIMTDARGKFFAPVHTVVVRLTIVDNRTGHHV